MKIAVDARELAGRPTGVGRYLAELIAEWSRSADAVRHDWRLYAHTPIRDVVDSTATVEVLPGDGGTLWEQWTLARHLSQDRPDVLFAPGYTAPLTAACPIAVTVHDVSFAAHPEWFSFREGLRRRSLTAWSARRARRVLTDSGFSRDEIVRHLGIPGEKIRVIPLGMTNHCAGAADARSLPTGDSSAATPLVLFVGSIFRRRHVDALIEAFATSVAKRVPGSRLEIVGENRTYPPIDLSAELGRYSPEIARRVTLRSYVDELALIELYKEATVFVFPSEYEGFGLTPLEALSMGVPPIVLDTAVAREVYGSAARYIPADLPHLPQLADALVELLTNPAARRTILSSAAQTLARYNWARAAAATLGVIEEAAGV